MGFHLTASPAMSASVQGGALPLLSNLSDRSFDSMQSTVLRRVEQIASEAPFSPSRRNLGAAGVDVSCVRQVALQSESFREMVQHPTIWSWFKNLIQLDLPNGLTPLLDELKIDSDPQQVALAIQALHLSRSSFQASYFPESLNPHGKDRICLVRGLSRYGVEYELLLCIFKLGEQTSIHDHGYDEQGNPSKGVYTVLEGAFSERRFSKKEGSRLQETGFQILTQGAFSVVEGDDIHQISHFGRADQLASALILYWPDGDFSNVSKYSESQVDR